MKPTATRVSSMADLKLVKTALAAEARQQALLEAARATVVKRDASAKELFIRAAGVVKTLPDKRRASLPKPLPEPVPRQHLLDESAALRETISDDFDVGTLLDVDEQLSFRRPGVGTDVTRKLRQGHWSIQRQLDLHGLRSDEARQVLGEFIREVSQLGIRCVRVIHGKGLGSPGKAPVLKGKVHSWLVQKNQVLAFVQARPAEGGAGALVVLLQPVSAAGRRD